MKIRIIILVLMIFCSTGACNNGDVGNKSETLNNDNFEEEVSNEKNTDTVENGDKEEMQVSEVNRTIIAETLVVEENNRKIRFILSVLNTIRAGKIQSAELTEVEGAKVLNIVAEDGTVYEIYLSSSGSVEAVKNFDTDEWIMHSEK